MYLKMGTIVFCGTIHIIPLATEKIGCIFAIWKWDFGNI